MAEVVPFGALEDIIHICTELSLILGILLAPCHSSVEVTLELLDIVSTVVTE
jgi:hypothetical protein